MKRLAIYGRACSHGKQGEGARSRQTRKQVTPREE